MGDAPLWQPAKHTSSTSVCPTYVVRRVHVVRVPERPRPPIVVLLPLPLLRRLVDFLGGLLLAVRDEPRFEGIKYAAEELTFLGRRRGDGAVS